MPELRDPQNVTLFHFLLGLLVLIVPPALAFSHSPAPTAAQPVVSFGLAGSPGAGVLDPAKPLHLSISLTGIAASEESVVAIVEAEPFVSRLVPMRADQERGADFRSIVTLEPYLSGSTSLKEKALRVRVTFAQLNGMELKRFLIRSVYLTMGLPVETEMISTASFQRVGEEQVGDLSDGFLETVGRLAAASEEEDIAEHNLIPDPIPAEAQAYWRQVSQRIGRTWSQPTQMPDTESVARSVGVQFRLHANGEAQLIQIERSSGVSAIDEAGLQAVLQAHPFPPFPADVHYRMVNMHVELGQTLVMTRPAPPLNSSGGAH